jgi:hypothetical protein
MELINKTGWEPSPDDDRDYPLRALPVKLAAPPIRASIETFVEPMDNQQTKPWCVSFNVCDAIEDALRMRGTKIPVGGLSKAYLYARCKQLDGIPNQDGTFIRTALQIAATEGICPDYLCPTATYLQQDDLPVITSEMRAAAANYKITGYARLKDAAGYADQIQMKQAIAAGQFVIIGSWVEEDNWLDGDDLISEPKGRMLGGHCTRLFGYDNEQHQAGYVGLYDGGNSWGPEWGNRGKYHMTYSYVAWRDLSTGTPALQEAWTFTVAGEIRATTREMPAPMQIIPPGYTMLPFRGIYEALEAPVDWYTNSQGKAVAVATVELKDRTVVIEATQDSNTLRVFRT